MKKETLKMPKKARENGQESEQELAQKLNQAQQRKIEACGKEINAVLEKYKMALNMQPFIDRDGTIKGNVGIVPRPEQPRN